MAEIIDLDKKRRSIAAKKGFRSWTRFFSEIFHEESRLEDLSNTTLQSLIQSGEQTERILYEFIMEVKGLGSESQFHLLGTEEKMAIMDIALFILDQIRFECMRRLGWVETYPAFHIPLVDLVNQFSEHFSALKHQTPALSPAHPRYSEYRATFENDRGAFIRRLIPAAIEAFREKE